MRLDRINLFGSTLEDESRLSKSLGLCLETKAYMVLVSFYSGVVRQLEVALGDSR